MGHPGSTPPKLQLKLNLHCLTNTYTQAVHHSFIQSEPLRLRKKTIEQRMYSPTPPPPLPPPKPSSHEASRLGTPSISQSPRPSSLADNGFGIEGKGKGIDTDASGLIPAPSRYDSHRLRQQQQVPPEIPDPGDTWLPKFLEDKSYVKCLTTYLHCSGPTKC